MEHYISRAGNIGPGSNYDNSMCQRKNPCWGLSDQFHNSIVAINAAIEKGKVVAIWQHGSKPTCMQKYGNERLLGVFIVESITKRGIYEPSDQELGWTNGKWEYVINYSKYYDISALDFGKPSDFGMSNFCRTALSEPKNYFKKGVESFDNLLPLLPFMGCVKTYSS